MILSSVVETDFFAGIEMISSMTSWMDFSWRMLLNWKPYDRLLWLYPSHLLIAIEWSGVWLDTVTLSECFCQHSLNFWQDYFGFPYHNAKAGVYDFLLWKWLEEKCIYFVYFLLALCKDRKCKRKLILRNGINCDVSIVVSMCSS